jgi:hypothetical protein
MTQGHRGSLLLRCKALSSSSPCRFIPALCVSGWLRRKCSPSLRRSSEANSMRTPLGGRERGAHEAPVLHPIVSAREAQRSEPDTHQAATHLLTLAPSRCAALACGRSCPAPACRTTTFHARRALSLVVQTSTGRSLPDLLEATAGREQSARRHRFRDSSNVRPTKPLTEVLDLAPR